MAQRRASSIIPTLNKTTAAFLDTSAHNRELSIDSTNSQIWPAKTSEVSVGTPFETELRHKCGSKLHLQTVPSSTSDCSVRFTPISAHKSFIIILNRIAGSSTLSTIAFRLFQYEEYAWLQQSTSRDEEFTQAEVCKESLVKPHQTEYLRSSEVLQLTSSTS